MQTRRSHDVGYARQYQFLKQAHRDASQTFVDLRGFLNGGVFPLRQGNDGTRGQRRKETNVRDPRTHADPRCFASVRLQNGPNGLEGDER